jgi:hypothetical protein
MLFFGQSSGIGVTEPFHSISLLRDRMIRIVITGFAAVFGEDDSSISDPAILKALDGLVYDDERFTDYLDGTSDEVELASALFPGGNIRFSHTEDADLLTATTEYRSHRQLTESELRLLAEYTMGQWSDGIGENWTCESPKRCGYSIMCLTAGDGMGPNYPSVRVVAE